MVEKAGHASSHQQEIREGESTNEGGIVDPLPLELSDFLSTDRGTDWSFLGYLSNAELPPDDLQGPATAELSLGLDPQGPRTPSVQFPNVNGESEEGKMQARLESLRCISQALEDMLQSAITALLQQNIQRYPISDVFALFKRLSDALHPPDLLHPQSLPGATSDRSDFPRLRATLLVVTCYVHCVEIMATISEGLFWDLSRRKSASDGSSSPEAAQMAYITLSKLDAGSDNFSSSVNAQDEFLVGEAFVRLDPLGHAFAAALATLRTGILQLRDIEVKLDIPQPQGVAAKMDPLVRSPRSQPSAPHGQEPTRPGTSYACAGNSYPVRASVKRFVALLWEDEVPTPSSEIPKATLARLWYYQREISSLVRQHNVCYI